MTKQKNNFLRLLTVKIETETFLNKSLLFCAIYGYEANMNLSQNIRDVSFCAIDLETSGSYPMHSEICEMAAVKYQNGQIVDRFQTLVKPSHKMSDFIIGIHGITNEMVADAPKIEQVLPAFMEFIKSSACIAHHIPFDLGFLVYELEKRNMKLPDEPAFCSSRLARKIVPDSPNHKLQTLANYLHLPMGTAHRALADSEACLSVFWKCMERLELQVKGPVTLTRLFQEQKEQLYWKNFSIDELKNVSYLSVMIEAINKKMVIEASYQSQYAKEARSRPLIPVGIVRSPDGDWLQAKCLLDNKEKRFYLNRFTTARIIGPRALNED